MESLKLIASIVIGFALVEIIGVKDIGQLSGFFNYGKAFTVIFITVYLVYLETSARSDLSPWVTNTVGIGLYFVVLALSTILLPEEIMYTLMFGLFVFYVSVSFEDV